MDKSDELIIKEYIEGNDDSFKYLVDKYTPSLFNYSARFVGVDNAKDIVQDVFLKAWKNIRKFDSTKAIFKTWLFTINRNTLTDYFRKKKMINFSSLDKEEESFESNIVDGVVLPDEILIKLEDKNLLNSLLDKIPNHYKEVLVLYYQEEMTFSEIGQLLDKPLNTVKSYHHRALILLRKMF